MLREAPVAFVCTLRNPDAPVSSMLLAELALLGATWLTLEPLTVAAGPATAARASPGIRARATHGLHTACRKHR